MIEVVVLGNRQIDTRDYPYADKFTARDSSVVIARDRAAVVAHDNSTVVAQDRSTVVAQDRAVVVDSR